MSGILIHHLPPLVAGKDGREQRVLFMKRPPGSQLLPFPPKSAVALLTQPQQHFLQLSAPTQQMGQGSQLALALTKNCWIAVPSITHPSGADGSQQHPSCPLACPHQVLLQKHLAEDPTLALYKRPALSPCPSTEAALTPAGRKMLLLQRGIQGGPGPLAPSPSL